MYWHLQITAPEGVRVAVVNIPQGIWHLSQASGIEADVDRHFRLDKSPDDNGDAVKVRNERVFASTHGSRATSTGAAAVRSLALHAAVHDSAVKPIHDQSHRH